MKGRSLLLGLWLALFAGPSHAEQYIARNADWAHRLEELTQARQKNILALGFETHWAAEKPTRTDAKNEPVIHFEKGLTTEEQKDCALREIKEVESFLKETRYQKYLKGRKIKDVWLTILDNSDGKLSDTQLRYGPDLVHAGYDIDGKFEGFAKFPNPVLLVSAVLTSKHSCIIPTYENLAFSFDWWDQPENAP